MIYIADRDELRLRQSRERPGVDVPDFAAAHEGGSYRRHVRLRPHKGKYFALIRRKKASDSAISSIPFMPSSMLTHP